MRARWVIALAVAITAGFPSNVQAGDGWRVVDTAGVVRVGGPGYMPVALTRDQELPSDAWIETASGRAVLVRGHETVIVEPNSRVQLPSARVNGNTQILQSVGSAIYKIGKQKKPHFQVDTPYLAAVVKGTAFKVTVEDDNASVSVTEGLVEVWTPDMQDVEFVRPGFTALVSRDNSGDVVVDPTRSGDRSAPEVPKSEGSSVQAVVIPTAIGDVELDVKDVSSGLVSNDVVPMEPTPVKGDSKDGNVDGDTKSDGPSRDRSLSDLGPAPPVDVSVVDERVGPTDVGPTIDAPGNPAVGPALDVTVDEIVDNIRGQGNSPVQGVGNGRSPPAKPGPT